jgi:hypothetical protein
MNGRRARFDRVVDGRSGARDAAAVAHPNEVFVRELYAAMHRGDGRALAKALLPDTR